MLSVQEYLKSKTFDDLKNELGIICKFHDTLPLVILNYNQIESPKTDPIVRECRALVLHSETKDVVAKSMNRFFNWGEVQDEMKLFDFNNCFIQEKVDGSLVLLFYFNGHWLANTRGSFGLDQIATGVNLTWQEAFCKAMNIKELDELDNFLDRSVTYVCEFCSPWNKVVRRYEQPTMYLLTAFIGTEEVHLEKVDKWIFNLFKLPERYEFKSIEEVQAFLQSQAESDPTYEGVVLRDKNNLRYKVKNSTYLGLHRMRGEGDNLFHPKHLLPFILAGEEDELLTYFPEVRSQYFELKSKVAEYYIELLETWADNKDIENQKDFALAVKDKTPFSSVLFQTRKKYGSEQKSAHIRQEWKFASDQILKRIK